MLNNLDEILQVDTPENVAFGYDVAGIGSRFLAALVDATILAIIQIGFAVLGILFALGFHADTDNNFTMWFSALTGLASFLFYWGYYIFFEMQWNGQSPGKRMAKLRVIRADGLPITLSESVIRNLVRLVDFLPVAYGLGVVVMFVQPQARRLGDLAAGTIVIHERKATTLQEMAQPQSQKHLTFHVTEDALSKFFPVEQLTAQDIQTAENFLLRRQDLSNRGALAVQIIKALYHRVGMEYPGMSMAQAEDTLVAIVKASRQHE